MKLTQQQTQVIIDNGKKKGLSTQSIITSLVKNGYEPEGVNIEAVKQTIQPTQTAVPTKETFLGGLKNDLNTRVDRVTNIQSNPNSTVAEKGLQTFGQGAGLAANAIEKTAEQIPGVKQVFGAIGSGINWLTTTPVIKAIGSKIGDNKALQEVTTLYDSDQNFKDSVDAVANIVRLGGDVEMAKQAVDFTKNVTNKIMTKINTPPVEPPPGGGGGGAAPIIEKAGATSTASHIYKDVVPSLERISNEQVTKALQLTAGDVKNIESATGNVVGEFMGKNNLIGNNLLETQKLVSDFFDANYKQVRVEIAKVPDLYKVSSVPRYTDSLNQIKKAVDGVSGLEKESVVVDNLLNNAKNGGTVTLADVQQVKELLDEHFNLYKVTGDVKEGVTKQGIVVMRKELKNFIEKEVKAKTNTDIKPLNNNVATSKSILKSSEGRATSGITKANLNFGDAATFGGGSIVGGPIVGLLALLGKKVLESPAMRFRIAKWVDSISDARKVKLEQEVSSGIVPKEVEKIVYSGKTTTITAKNTKNSNTAISNTIPQNEVKATKLSTPKKKLLDFKNIPNKQGGFINLGEIAKSIDNTDKNIMLAFNEAVLAGKTPSKSVALAAQKIADTIGLESSTGTNKAIANDFQIILDMERENFKKTIKK